MRTILAGLVALVGCAAPETEDGDGVPDPFASGKNDDTSSLEIAWDPPRPLRVGTPLIEQELFFSLKFSDAEVQSKDETVDEDGTINIDLVLKSEGMLVYEVGRYFLDVEQAQPLTIEATPQDPRYEARWLIGRPGEDELTAYEGNRVEFPDAGPGRYKVAVLTGVTPDLEGVFRYSIATR